MDYIINVYIAVWFAIKKKSNFTNDPKHFFSILRSAQKSYDRARSVVDKVLQRHAFYAHPEHILIALIDDPEQCARELG